MYIFRWKEMGMEVLPSRHDSQEETWKWAIKWLRPANETDDAVAEMFIRSAGEVTEYKES